MSTEDPGHVAHRVARDHLVEMYEHLDREHDGEDVDWVEAGAMTVFDGCEDCIVREVLNAGLTSLANQGFKYDRIDQLEDWAAERAMGEH